GSLRAQPSRSPAQHLRSSELERPPPTDPEKQLGAVRGLPKSAPSTKQRASRLRQKGRCSLPLPLRRDVKRKPDSQRRNGDDAEARPLPWSPCLLAFKAARRATTVGLLLLLSRALLARTVASI